MEDNEHNPEIYEEDPFEDIDPEVARMMYHSAINQALTGLNDVAILFKQIEEAKSTLLKSFEEIHYRAKPIAQANVEENPMISHDIVPQTTGEALVSGALEIGNISSLKNLYSNGPQRTDKSEEEIASLNNDFQRIESTLSGEIDVLQPDSLPVQKDPENNISNPRDTILGNKAVTVPTVDEIKKVFMKDCFLVLYHHAYSETIMNYAEQLKDICEVRSFISEKEASDFILRTNADFCVITSEVDGEAFIEKILNKDVFAISVHCNDTQFRPQWIKKYKRKVVQVETDFAVIVDNIKKKFTNWRENMSSLRLDFPMFAPLFHDLEMTQNSVSRVYKSFLTWVGDEAQGKRNFLALARVLYKDTANMDEFEKTYNTYDMKSILRWYTRDSFLHKLANNALRLATQDTIYYCNYVLQHLVKAIREQYNQKSKSFNGILYRAGYMSDEDWLKLQQNQGKDIEMLGFLSTTKSKDIAECFFADMNGKGKALMTIIVPPTPSAVDSGFAEMKEFSDFCDEEEVLFNILSTFTVLETLSSEIGTEKCPHVVLLYGAQKMNEHMYFNDTIIEIELDAKELAKCAKCQVDNRLSEKMMFVNLENTQEYICYNCVKISNDLNMRALVATKSTTASSLTIEGMIIKYKEKLDVPFYGYRCKGVLTKS